MKIRERLEKKYLFRSFFMSEKEKLTQLWLKNQTKAIKKTS